MQHNAALLPLARRCRLNWSSSLMATVQNDSTPEKSNRILLSFASRSSSSEKSLRSSLTVSGPNERARPNVTCVTSASRVTAKCLKVHDSGGVSSVSGRANLGDNARVASSRNSYISKSLCRYFAIVSFPCAEFEISIERRELVSFSPRYFFDR